MDAQLKQHCACEAVLAQQGASLRNSLKAQLPLDSHQSQ